VGDAGDQVHPGRQTQGTQRGIEAGVGRGRHVAAGHGQVQVVEGAAGGPAAGDGIGQDDQRRSVLELLERVMAEVTEAVCGGWP
jgi:hypothetical protein